MVSVSPISNPNECLKCGYSNPDVDWLGLISCIKFLGDPKEASVTMLGCETCTQNSFNLPLPLGAPDVYVPFHTLALDVPRVVPVGPYGINTPLLLGGLGDMDPGTPPSRLYVPVGDFGAKYRFSLNPTDLNLG
jgi:hypothetical protein